jgi:hypothetical protein
VKRFAFGAVVGAALFFGAAFAGFYYVGGRKWEGI